MREVPEALGPAANTREWEPDREAWNLPGKPGEIGARTTSTPADEVAAEHHTAASNGVASLPKNVWMLDRDQLRAASGTRDERLSILFRRWPSLTKIELKEISKLYEERQRLARCIGVLRNGRHAAGGA